MAGPDGPLRLLRDISGATATMFTFLCLMRAKNRMRHLKIAGAAARACPGRRKSCVCDWEGGAQRTPVPEAMRPPRLGALEGTVARQLCRLFSRGLVTGKRSLFADIGLAKGWTRARCRRQHML